jgi:hypothetical protein
MHRRRARRWVVMFSYSEADTIENPPACSTCGDTGYAGHHGDAICGCAAGRRRGRLARRGQAAAERRQAVDPTLIVCRMDSGRYFAAPSRAAAQMFDATHGMG